MNNIGGPELVLLIGVAILVVGLAPYVTWRRGGSRARIVVAFLVSLVPYVGWIAGMILALTTRRSLSSPLAATVMSQPTVTLAGPVQRMRVIGVALAVLLAGIASGAAGYYLARQDSPTTKPTWVDREIRVTGAQNVLRCTYHLGDATVVVRESVIRPEPNNNPFRVGTAGPLAARTPECPPDP